MAAPSHWAAGPEVEAADIEGVEAQRVAVFHTLPGSHCYSVKLAVELEPPITQLAPKLTDTGR